MSNHPEANGEECINCDPAWNHDIKNKLCKRNVNIKTQEMGWITLHLVAFRMHLLYMKTVNMADGSKMLHLTSFRGISSLSHKKVFDTASISLYKSYSDLIHVLKPLRYL